MRADWDDAPSYLSKRKTDSGLLIGVVIGCAITALGLYVSSRFMPEEQPEQAIAVTQQEPAPIYEEVEPPQYSAPTPSEKFWQDQKRREEQRRQAAYNESNYTPRGADNVVSTEGIRQSSAYQNNRSGSSQSSERTIDHEGQWIPKWGGGGSYFAKWTAINNQIDGRTVCANHKRGSIDYRECRKAAKQWFHNQCRLESSEQQKQRYCSAASRFSPMG
ncbi:hypothetical protein SAMN05878282_1165 [Aquipseudomonas alcaligenes]|uniref:Uncharacterized protein n=2 Tax=Aquipseudomonas alcaligenes TaxID=43263 RepID=A0A1N6XUG6_AQUAC|nr:hypothetical protein SAMN05878282_1165 [Pseudomonas alcaligenes]